MPTAHAACMLLLVLLLVASPLSLALLSQPVFHEVQTQGQSMPPRYCHSGTILNRWSLGIFYGGRTNDGFLTDFWTYNLVSSQWALRVPITFNGVPPPALCWSCLTVWDDTASQSLLMGGLDSSEKPIAGTWLLTYAQPSPYWQQLIMTGASPAARFGHSCARVPGKIATMIFGGFDGQGNVLNDLWILHSNFVWKKLPSVHPSRPPALAHAAIYLGDDNIIIYGGVDSTMSTSSDTYSAYVGISDDSLFTHPAPLNWSIYACSGTPPAAPSVGFAFATHAKSLLIFGGESSLHPADVSSSSLFVYKLDTFNRKWSITRPTGFPSQRSHHVLLVDQCSETLLAFGGRNSKGLVLYTDSLNFPSNIWRELSIPALAPPPRTYHVLVAFTDAIIVHGGINFDVARRDSVLRDTWRFSFSDQTWTQLIPVAGVAAVPYRMYHAAARVGQFVVVTGGVDNNFVVQSSTMLINSVNGEWLSPALSTSLPAMCNHTLAVVLNNGRSLELRGASGESIRLIAFGGFQGGTLSNRAWTTEINLNPRNGRGASDLMLSFDGLFDYLVVSDFQDLHGEFTIAFWMKAGGFEVESQAILSIGLIGMGLQIVRCHNSGSICFYCQGSKLLVGRITVNDGIWHHVAVTFSVASRRMSIYIDGSLDATRTDDFRAPIFGTFDFFVGRGGLQSASYFPGSIDDIYVWKSALSAAQVSSLLSGQSTSLNLVAFWSFDNSGAPYMQQNMFSSVQHNFIMYCGGGHGHCPNLVLSSAPLRPGSQSNFHSGGWIALPYADGSPEPPARHSHAAAALYGQKLLVHGGFNNDGNVLDDLWLGSILLGKLISWTQLFQPQTFGLYAHSLISHFDIPNQDHTPVVTILSRKNESSCNIDGGSCRKFSVTANFMDSCPSECTVPLMHGTRSDITFKNDIYGFGGNSLSSVVQNNLWSLLSDGSWHNIIPSSPQNHKRTGWPQIVPKMLPLSGKWDGDTLVSVSSNDDVYQDHTSAGFLTIMLYSTARRVWSPTAHSEVLNPPSDRRGHLLTSYHGSLYPGQIVVFGGNDGNTFFNDIYILNPHATVSNLKFYNWTSVAHISAAAPPRLSQAGGFVYNDTLWIYGGVDASSMVQGTIWSFNFVTKHWLPHSHIASAGLPAPNPCYGCNLVFIDAPSSIRAIVNAIIPQADNVLRYLVFGRTTVPATFSSIDSKAPEQDDLNLSPSIFLLTITPISNGSFQTTWNAIPSMNTPSSGPPLRHHASAAMYGRTLVMYGGFGKDRKPLDDFWILKDGTKWVQLQQPNRPPARGCACMVPLLDLDGIYIFAGAADVNNFSPLKDLWFVKVSSSSPSSFVVTTPSLSVAYAGKRATFSVFATDFFNRKKDSLICYDDLLLQLTNEVEQIQGIVVFDSASSVEAGGCVYLGSYLPVHANLYHLTLRISGYVVDGFPRTVNVKSATPDPDFSGIIFPSDTGPCDGLSTEGSTFFIVRTFDRNGNSGMTPSQISVEGYLLPDPFWNSLLDQNDEENWEFSSSLQTNIIDSYNGFFQVTMSNTRSGNYSVSVLLQGEHVSGSPFRCSVDTGNVEPTLVRISSVTIFTVGTSSSFVLQTVDQFGNNISTAPGVAGDVVTAQLISDANADAVVLEGDRGLWTMNVHPQVTGTSRLVVVINDVSIFDQQVYVKALMQPVVYSQAWFSAIRGIPPSIVILVFALVSFSHYRACIAQQLKILTQLGDVAAPPETVVETFDDVDKVHLDPDWLKADEACKQLRGIGADHDARDEPGRRLIYVQMVDLMVTLGDKLGLSLDEGAVLQGSMLDDLAVQAVFASFICGDGGGKDGLEELQTRLRRISTCAQFSANTPRDLDEFNEMALDPDFEGLAPDSARADTTDEQDLGARIRRGSVFDIDV